MVEERAMTVFHALSVGVRCSTSLVSTPRFDLVDWLRSTWLKFTRVLATRGMADAIPKLKATLVACRKLAVSDLGVEGLTFPLPKLPLVLSAISRRKVLMQLSRIGRALPTPSEEVVDEAMRKHREVLTSSFVTPSDVLGEYRSVCSDIFSKPFVASFPAPSPAATTEVRRSEGGGVSELTTLVDSFKNRKVTYEGCIRVADLFQGLPIFGEYRIVPRDLKERFAMVRRMVSYGSSASTCLSLGSCLFKYDKSYEIGQDDWDAIRERLFLNAASYEALWLRGLAGDWVPPATQSAVLERGWKCRVVTPGYSPFIYFCGSLNSYLLGCISDHPPSASSQKGRPVEHLDWSAGRKGNLVRSLDLTSATDLLPHDLLSEGVSGIAEASGMPGFFELVLERAVGPHRMTCKNGDKVFTSRGTLMGNPVSWPLLCAYTTMIHRMSGSDGWYATVGDDYIGSHTEQTNARLDRAISRSGGEYSRPKDIKSNTGYGVLAEELVSVPRRRVYRTASVRALTGVSKEAMPPWSLGPSVTEAGLGVLRLADLQEIVSDSFGAAIADLRRHNIDPGTPRWLGGGGFPLPPKQESLRLCRGLLGQSQDYILKALIDLASAWSVTRPQRILLDIARDVVPALVQEFSHPATLENGLTVDDLLSRWAADQAFAYVLVYGVDEVRTLRLSKVGARIGSVLEDLRERSHWVPIERTVRPGRLLRALMEKEPRWAPVDLNVRTLRALHVWDDSQQDEE